MGDVALILGAYLLGSLPYLSALGKARGIALEGDLHISLWQRGGQLIGLIGILGEFIRGAIPILVGKSLGFNLFIIALAGLAVVSGQMWPIFSRFDGEKGNTTGLAMAAALAPKPLFIALMPIAIGAAVRTVPRLLDASQSLNERFKFGGPPSRSLPLGMAIGFFLLPIASWWLEEPLVITSGYFALFILIMVRRLTAGLRGDLEVNTNVKGILVNRLLYDRSRLTERREGNEGEKGDKRSKEVHLALRDKTLVCRDCGREFTFTVGEQEFYSSHGLLNEPRHCPLCRAARHRQRSTGGGSRQVYRAICATCGVETTVPFEPMEGRPVYCRDCYAKIRGRE